MTKYEYEYYSDYQKLLNTNTNTIQIFKNYQIQIRILFGLSKITEYEYKYYSDYQKWLNTNTNTIRIIKNDWIRIWILFGFSKVTEYEYYSAFENWPNTNTIQIFKNDRIRIRILFSFSKMTKDEYTHHHHRHHFTLLLCIVVDFLWHFLFLAPTGASYATIFQFFHITSTRSSKSHHNLLKLHKNMTFKRHNYFM